MDNKIKEIIEEAVNSLIDNTTSSDKIEKLIKKHTRKVHFIPIRYRIFNGLLQSMNIQFGNFIEKLLHIIIENEEKLDVYKNFSGKRSKVIAITEESNNLIDTYISDSQNNIYSTTNLKYNFNNLIEKCISIEKLDSNRKISIKHDIDVLFRDNNTAKSYYLEVKYNDDHDTGKFININRKLIKTYIGLCNVLEIYDIKKFKPILYYMTRKRMKGNIYLPEEENIYRANKLFKEFFNIDYDDLDKFMNNIGENDEIITRFDALYLKIRKDIELK